jgi:hypothetical protein
MARNFDDWLQAYVKYASVTEAPVKMHFWAGVGAIAGALRRKVWIDMKRYQWLVNFYIIFVAPPGIVSKSTTADISMDLLKQVPGINFGPDVVTWQSLVTSFAESAEAFEYNGEHIPMSAMTLVASELGNLIDPQDRNMINTYINLWDGRKSLEKQTKTSGNDTIEGPWINILGCTTPNWIADNMPQATIGGGFTSRCVFVYADRKDRFIPYVDEVVTSDDGTVRLKLIQDLEHIAMSIAGPFSITQEAREFEHERYKKFWDDASSRMDNNLLEGYAARKQTMLHKLAMVLSVSRGDSRVISLEDLVLGNHALEQLEPDMPKVFSQIGRSEESLQVDKLLRIIKRHGKIPYDQAYRVVHGTFPNAKDFEGVLSGCIKAGYVSLKQEGSAFILEYKGGLND